jgi:excisionase family DNA binding protein
MHIHNLAGHASHYVTVAELAEYWAVSRQQIYKRIESGALEAIRLGSRLYRVRTRAALEYEERVSVNSAARPPTTISAASWSEKLPHKIGPQRVR